MRLQLEIVIAEAIIPVFLSNALREGYYNESILLFGMAVGVAYKVNYWQKINVLFESSNLVRS